MIDRVIPAVTVVAAVGSGLMAGLFFVFSAFLMTVLGRQPPAQGMTTMQSINAAILNPLFGLLFFGTTVACLLLVVAAPFSDRPGAVRLLVGGLLFVVGAVLLTMVVNVPLNNELAAADPASVDGVHLWEHYLARWTAWNHVRLVASTGAAAILTVAATG